MTLVQAPGVFSVRGCASQTKFGHLSYKVFLDQHHSHFLNKKTRLPFLIFPWWWFSRQQARLPTPSVGVRVPVKSNIVRLVNSI